jgi:putative peptidoglycan lipid II flippase
LVLANKLGATRAMDVYLVSIALPTFIANLSLTTGTLALVPVFKTAMDQAGAGEAWGSCVRAASLAGALTLAGLLPILGFAEPLIHLMAPGLSGPDAVLAAGLLRMVSIGTFFDTQRGVLSAFYYASERFLVPQLAPSLNHLVMLMSAVYAFDRVGLWGLAFGWAAGSVLMWLVMLMAALREHGLPLLKHSPLPGLRRLAALVLPATMVGLASLATPLIDRAVASQLPVGSISYLGYATKIQEIIMRMIPMAVTLTLFPMISGSAARKEWQQVRILVTAGTRWMLLGSLPVAAIMGVMGEPLVAALFERGAFGRSATVGVSSVLGWYAVAFVADILAYFLAYVFFATGRQRLLIWTSLLVVGMTFALDVILSRRWGVGGIAAAHLAVSCLAALLMYHMLNRHENVSGRPFSVVWMARVVPAGVAMALLLETIRRLGLAAIDDAFTRALTVLGASMAGLFVYLGLLRLCGTPEAITAERAIRGRAADWVRGRRIRRPGL